MFAILPSLSLYNLGNCHFVGDFNLPNICWSTLTGTSPFSISFCDFVYEMNLSQLVMDSTHVKGNILDLVLTNAENFIYDLFIADSLPLIPSDHCTVSFKIKYALPPSQRTSHKYFFDYSKANFDGLCGYAKLHPHSRRKCNKHATSYNLSKLQNLEKQLQNKLMLAKTTYEKNLIDTFSKVNSSKIYKYIHSLTNHGTIPPTVTFDSSTVALDGDKASMFIPLCFYAQFIQLATSGQIAYTRFNYY